MPHHRVVLRQQAFGYTYEELNLLVAPMARVGAEPLGSMGTDTPIAVLSARPRMLFDYFQQLFAQVTNPPLDAIREEVVTSLHGTVGPEGDLLNPTPQSCHQIALRQPILRNHELAKLINLNPEDTVRGRKHGMRSAVIRCLYPVAKGGEGLRRALDDIRDAASKAIADGAQILIISDRESNETLAPIPSLLAVSAIHHHLVRTRTRTQVGLVVESGDAREVHHMAALISFGAAAINPYMAFESIDDMIDRGVIEGISREDALQNYIKAAGKGVLKVMSKMGISTLASYTGSQLFQAIGISQQVLDEYFVGMSCPVGGIDLDDIAADVATRHQLAYLDRPDERAHRELEVGGEYQWRREGEYHLFNPDTVFKLQHSTRTGQYEVFKEYTKLVDDQSERMASLRGLLKFKDPGNTGRPAISIDEVEPASEIVKRFSTGAMSYGSISAEAHETLAIAMNRLGARSNSGEGGEATSRFEHDPNGDWRRSAIKQVASGRFGVTSHYLSNCTDIQIKMAQGAKPGEGGQLPGHKVYPWVAEVRHSTPGVGLISPPPHHDIYSIEDLAQLIHDLKNANPPGPRACEAGERERRRHCRGGGVQGARRRRPDLRTRRRHRRDAADVAEARGCAVGAWPGRDPADPAAQRIRDRIVVQVDGQLKTGRDVVVAALLGAEEFGFATAPLVVSGCIMMRVCHLDTCPVGVATQNPLLRQRFDGKPEFVENFFMFIAEEVRELMAQLGFRTVNEMVGQVDALDTTQAAAHWKAHKLDLTPVLHEPDSAFMNQDLYCSSRQDHGLDKALDQQLIVMSREALDSGTPVRFSTTIANVNRTVGTMLGHELTKAYGGQGPSGRHHRHHVRWLSRQQLRGVRAQGYHAAGLRRRQRLCRQGPLGWPDRAAAVRQCARRLCGRGQHHRWQRDPVRRHQR